MYAVQISKKVSWHDLIGRAKESEATQVTFALLEETLLSAKCYKTRRISSENNET